MSQTEDLQKTDNDVDVANLMAQGKRHMLVHDFASAVQCWEEVCKLLDAQFGVAADECADAYMNYGNALLELHRHESGALDGLIDSKAGEGSEVEDEEEDEEIEDEDVDVEDKTNDNNSNKPTNGQANEEDISVSPSPAEQNTVSSTNGVTQSSDQTAASSSNGNSANAPANAAAATDAAASSSDDKEMEVVDDSNQPSTSTGITNENRAEDEEEDTGATNIEVSFELISMAKKIYQRQTEYRDDAFLKLSDAMQKIGEILIEWDNTEDAIKEFNDCLEIRKRHLPADDRLIAEVYYHLGLSQSLSQKVEEANTFFRHAVNVVEHRMNRLKSSYTSESNSEAIAKIENEIKELELILPEMKAKIEESQDEISTSKLASVVAEDEKNEEEKIAEKKKQILAKPIMNVTHLVKRKRDEAALEPENNAKKLKNGNEVTSSEDDMVAANGSQTNGSNGNTNSEPKEVEMKDA